MPADASRARGAQVRDGTQHEREPENAKGHCLWLRCGTVGSFTVLSVLSRPFENLMNRKETGMISGKSSRLGRFLDRAECA